MALLSISPIPPQESRLVESITRKPDETLRTTWSKVRLHAISHIVLNWMGGISLSGFSLPQSNAHEIMKNQWYILAKDTGLVYVIPMLPIVVVSFYLVVFTLTAQGMSLIAITVLSAPPRRNDPLSRVSAQELTPIAFSLPNDDFDLAAIFLQSEAMMFKFKENHNISEVFQTLQARAESSIQYPVDFCTLLLFWLFLSIILRTNSWIQMSWTDFRLVCLMLVALISISSIRASLAFLAKQILQIKFVAGFMWLDPSFLASVLTRSDALAARINRLEEILKFRKDEEDQRKLSQPSFRRVFGITPVRDLCHCAELNVRNKLSFYERGRKLDLFGSPRELSVADVFAYKFLVGADD
jgi:hypothetical protein